MSRLAMAAIFILMFISLVVLGVSGTRRVVFFIGLASLALLIALLVIGTISIPQIHQSVRELISWRTHG